MIHKIWRHSHFRVLKIQNFLRPPTVANIFKYHISLLPTFEWAKPCLLTYKVIFLCRNVISLTNYKTFPLITCIAAVSLTLSVGHEPSSFFTFLITPVIPIPPNIFYSHLLLTSNKLLLWLMSLYPLSFDKYL